MKTLHRILGVLSVTLTAALGFTAVGEAFASPAARIAAGVRAGALGKPAPSVVGRAPGSAYGALAPATAGLSPQDADAMLGRTRNSTLSTTDMVKMCQGDNAAAKAVRGLALRHANTYVYHAGYREDVVQQVLLKLLLRCVDANSAQPMYMNPDAYVYKMVKTTWIDISKQRGFHMVSLDDMIEAGTESVPMLFTSTDPVTRVHVHRALQRMQQHSVLNERQAEVLTYTVLGSQQEEIADGLGITRNMARKALSTALKKSKPYFAESSDE